MKGMYLTAAEAYGNKLSGIPLLAYKTDESEYVLKFLVLESEDNIKVDLIGTNLVVKVNRSASEEPVYSECVLKDGVRRIGLKEFVNPEISCLLSNGILEVRILDNDFRDKLNIPIEVG